MFKLTNSLLFKFSVRVRYAPSPTGMMHLGGLRTALFNKLFAIKSQGKFIIRIEDTDQNRNVQGSVQNIFDTLKWLDINPDESSLNPNQKFAPYVQSQRLSLYKNMEKILLKNNLAYPCFCSHERKMQSNSETKKKKKLKTSENDEENQQTESNSTSYDGKCSRLTLQQVKDRILKGEPYAVRIRSNLFEVPPVFIDQNYGVVPFVKFDDFVIIKKDGWPTFHFANVIDDWKMEITHIIRGEQWLTNTSKHIYLYKVLGVTVPKFLHLPLIQNQQGKKLAKRDPSSSLVTLRKDYEPEAIKTFIFRLGWNPKQNLNEKIEVDILTDEEMIDSFNQEGITKNPAKFDIKILNHLNRKALKNQWKQFASLQKLQSPSKQQTKRLNELKIYFISKINQTFPESINLPQEKLLHIWEIVHDRITTNSDIKENDYFFKSGNLTFLSERSIKDLKLLFGANTELKNQLIANYDKELFKKNKSILHNLRLILEHILPQSEFKEQNIAQKISQLVFENREIKSEELYHLLRFIITEQKSGPSILKVMMILGRNRCLELIESFHSVLQTSQYSG